MYAAPEQREGKGTGPYTDIYSFGIMLLEMCNSPFNTQAERISVLTDARSAHLNAAIPALQSVIESCLLVPEERPTAREILANPLFSQGQSLEVEALTAENRLLRAENQRLASELATERQHTATLKAKIESLQISSAISEQ